MKSLFQVVPAQPVRQERRPRRLLAAIERCPNDVLQVFAALGERVGLEDASAGGFVAGQTATEPLPGRWRSDAVCGLLELHG